MHLDPAALRSAGEALRPVIDESADLVMRTYDEARPDLIRQFDATAMAAVERDVRYHLAFLEEALLSGEPVLFDDYVGWAATLFAGIGLPQEWLLESLDFCTQAIGALVEPRHADVVDGVVRQAVERMPDRGVAPPSFVVESGPLGALAVGYIGALLEKDRTRAIRMVLDAVRDGVVLEDLYLQVIAPAQAELGRLWLTGKIGVADEHAATAITQTVLGALAAERAASEAVGRKVLMAALGPELHEVGARIVADFFELGGWDVVYLGANTPLAALTAALEAEEPDVVALSTTLAVHIDDAREAIDAVRRTAAGARTRILVGGRPFNLAPELWVSVGADGWAAEASSAVRKASELCAL